MVFQGNFYNFFSYFQKQLQMSENKIITKPKGRIVASRYMQTSKAVKSKNSKSQSNDSIKTLDDSLEFSKIEGNCSYLKK